MNKAPLVVLGLMGGLFSGLFGVGGGSVFIPAGVFLLGFDQKKAQGTSMLIMIFISIAGFSSYYLIHPFPLRPGLLMMLGTAIGAYIGGNLMRLFPGIWLRRMFAVYLVLIGIRMITL